MCVCVESLERVVPGDRERDMTRRTDTTADEGEEERGVSRDLRRDLELEEADGGAKDDDVDTNDEGLAVVTEIRYQLRRMRGEEGGVNTYNPLASVKNCEIPPRIIITPTARLTMRLDRERTLLAKILIRLFGKRLLRRDATRRGLSMDVDFGTS